MRAIPLLPCTITAALLTGMAGCDSLPLVEPFGGSHLTVTFAPAMPAPARAGTTPEPGAPPEGTYYSFHAIRYAYQRDSSGTLVTDTAGNPLVIGSYAFHIMDFEIRPAIELTSPCFIEDAGTRFPGLHVTRVADKLRQETGITDAVNPPAGADKNHVIDILTADRRVANLPLLQGVIKAVTTVSTSVYPATGAACVADGGRTDELPPAACMDDASNRVRLTLCQEFWAAHPEHYEGNDKVLTVPLNGEWYGAVSTLNPLNMSPIGGAGFFVDAVLTDIDGLLLTYRYKDFDGDGQPDYPAELPVQARSAVGVPFLAGTPVSRTRGIIQVPIGNPSTPSIGGQVAIFTDLDNDQVNF